MGMKRVDPHRNVPQRVDKSGQRWQMLQIITPIGDHQQAQLRQAMTIGQPADALLDQRVFAPGQKTVMFIAPAFRSTIAPSNTGNSFCQPVSLNRPLLSTGHVRWCRDGSALIAVNSATKTAAAWWPHPADGHALNKRRGREHPGGSPRRYSAAPSASPASDTGADRCALLTVTLLPPDAPGLNRQRIMRTVGYTVAAVVAAPYRPRVVAGFAAQVTARRNNAAAARPVHAGEGYDLTN